MKKHLYYTFRVEEITDETREDVTECVITGWGSALVVSRGVLHDTRLLPGFIAVVDGTRVGYAVYNIINDECELVAIESFHSDFGIGTALVDRVRYTAKKAHCRRLWLVTTNDNTNAIEFYQKRGFELRAVHFNAMDEARKLKRQIPLTGEHGIPIKHEFEFEVLL